MNLLPSSISQTPASSPAVDAKPASGLGLPGAGREAEAGLFADILSRHWQHLSQQQRQDLAASADSTLTQAGRVPEREPSNAPETRDAPQAASNIDTDKQTARPEAAQRPDDDRRGQETNPSTAQTLGSGRLPLAPSPVTEASAEELGLDTLNTDPEAGLRVVPLSANLNIVTTSEPQVNAQSMAAFARGMGMSEAQIQQLLGPHAAQAAQAAQAAGQGEAPSTLDQLQAKVSTPLGVNATATPTAGVNPSAATLHAAQAMNWQGAHLELNPQAAHDTASAQALAAQQPTTATSVDMLTIRDAEFSPEVWQALQARALANAQGGGRQGLAGSAALSLPTTPAALATDTPEASPALTGLGLSGPAGAARTLATRAGVPATPLPTGDVDNAYEELNQKFTTELAGRIQQQINSGEWKMKFALKPASLGHLDVQLEMRDGKLSAVFHTDNAMTQDLLSNGSQRLKEALAQMGHHNAAVWVGSDGAGQSPGQRSPNSGSPAPTQSLNPSASDARTSSTDTAGPSTHRSTQDSHLDLFA